LLLKTTGEARAPRMLNYGDCGPLGETVVRRAGNNQRRLKTRRGNIDRLPYRAWLTKKKGGRIETDKRDMFACGKGVPKQSGVCSRVVIFEREDEGKGEVKGSGNDRRRIYCWTKMGGST